MMWWAKIIGAFFGLLLTHNILGIILGAFIGHSFDKGLEKQREGTGNQQGNFGFGGFFSFNPIKAKEAFFKTTFLFMGHLAKADGRVSEREIAAAKRVMERFSLGKEQRALAIDYFNEGKQANFDVNQALEYFTNTCRQNRILMQMFMEIQFQVAVAEGVIGLNKKRILQRMAKYLGFTPMEFRRFENLYGAQSYSQRAYQQYRQYRPPPSPSTRTSLAAAYDLLGIQASATHAEIKRAYRRLMSQNHPDKLAAKGLPDEMMKVATEKTQQIRKAYECICKARDESA